PKVRVRGLWRQRPGPVRRFLARASEASGVTLWFRTRTVSEPLRQRPAAGDAARMRALVLALVLASGAAAQTPDPTGEPSPLPPSRDVTLDGVSIVGKWVAVEIYGDRSARQDLHDGHLAKVLVINPRGRAMLRGWDRRAGGAPEAFTGQVVGTRLRLDRLQGEGRLAVRGGWLRLHDPGGTTTAYAWQGR
ncbi:MAG: hypothetical protein AAFQ43_11750, partial [Bacteroidota bacterium]